MPKAKKRTQLQRENGVVIMYRLSLKWVYLFISVYRFSTDCSHGITIKNEAPPSTRRNDQDVGARPLQREIAKGSALRNDIHIMMLRI
jgi:hypothetical protein